MEPLAIAHRAVSRAGVTPDDSVVILGGGPIGQAVLAWVRQRGVSHITVSDPAPGRRALAERMGATHTIDPIGDELALHARQVQVGRVAALAGRAVPEEPGEVADGDDAHVGLSGRLDGLGEAGPVGAARRAAARPQQPRCGQL